jgi:hypothetical protein
LIVAAAQAFDYYPHWVLTDLPSCTSFFGSQWNIQNHSICIWYMGLRLEERHNELSERDKSGRPLRSLVALAQVHIEIDRATNMTKLA